MKVNLLAWNRCALDRIGGDRLRGARPAGRSAAAGRFRRPANRSRGDRVGRVYRTPRIAGDR